MYGLKVRKVTLQEAYNGEGRRLFDLMNQAYAPLFGYSSFTPNQVDYFLFHNLKLLYHTKIIIKFEIN